MSIIAAAANSINLSRPAFSRITINIRGGSVKDRLSAASKLLGYEHTHRDLMAGRPLDDASIDGPNTSAEVVWGRSAWMMLVDVSADGTLFEPVEVAITILDTKRSQWVAPGSERVFVYGDRIMHKKCDTSCPRIALQSIVRSHGFIFMDWLPVVQKSERE